MNTSHSNRSVPINNQKVLQDEEIKKKNSQYGRFNTASSYDKRKKIWIILFISHYHLCKPIHYKCKGKRITRFAKRSGGVRKIIRP